MKKRSSGELKALFLTICLLGIIFVLLFQHTGALSKSLETQSQQAAQTAVSRALMTCYAVEGCYPSSTDYLEQNYGLYIDHKKYLVDYRIFSTNVMPEVHLIPRSA
ncbi:MAG: hypothetical protein LKJ50_04280 [Clostridiales bacterium]|jgi:hypothetical protein|nr:hypothetical protein [Clostridiales bacterium]MCI1961156.1 hypothetical protein [Clostridiales bacterium]MCI2021597.1 hypothetical protein [Clostridiales bacterium]MCI2026383.1 hypothetical protein [Clostridiales bacterium]